MAYVPGEVVRRAINPAMTPARAGTAPPVRSSLLPGSNTQAPTQYLPGGSIATPGGLVPSGGIVPRSDVASTGGYGGYTLQPDPTALGNIVASDPGVMAAQLAYNTGQAQGNAGLRGLASSIAAQYGDPSFATDMLANQHTGVNLDPGTAELAARNTLAGHSTLALLNLANQHATDAMYSHLASRGLLNSGETAFEGGLESARDSLSRFNKLSDVQSQLQTGITSNINTQQTLRDAVTDAINKAKATGTLPGPTHVTVGSVPGMPAGRLGGSTGLAPGSYINARGAGLPNYQLAPSGSLAPNTYHNVVGAGRPNYQPGGLPNYKPLAAPHLSGAPTMTSAPSIQRGPAAPINPSAPNAGGAQ